MKLILTLIVTVAIGGAIFYFYNTQQQQVYQKVQGAQKEAQEKADAYRKNQENMMKQIQQ